MTKPFPRLVLAAVLLFACVIACEQASADFTFTPAVGPPHPVQGSICKANR